MDCSRARELIGERMDGERLPDRARRQLDAHVESCDRCTAFADAAWRVRESVRFEVAAAVPDLVGSIMTRVREETHPPGRAKGLAPARQRLDPHHAEGRRTSRGLHALAPIVAALIVGAAAGSFLVGGPRMQPTTIAAADITRGVASAARSLNAYSARFAMTEYHFRPQVPVRTFSLNVAFAAPGRFRMRVVDTTAYPSTSWTPNDLTLVVNGSRSFRSGPETCAVEGPLTCPSSSRVSNNPSPFGTSPLLPTDLILPIGTLDDPAAVTVLGRARVAGRLAYQVELPFSRAAALFPFLHAGGSWRPFFPEDRVVLWIDAHSYFPLEYRVFPSTDPARRAWEAANGLPTERPRDPIFVAIERALRTSPPPPRAFSIPSGHRAQASATPGPVSLAQAQRLTGYRPVTPLDHAGLRLYGAVVSPTVGGSAPQTLITYASGLAWLKVQETTGWDLPAPFAPIAPQAEEVHLANGGIGYYEPATANAGRRLAIHSAGYDLYVESDLSRADLLAVGSSLPLHGERFPASWLSARSAGARIARVTLAQAIARQPFTVDLPTTLPAGYAFASAELVRVPPTTGLNVYYQQRESGLGAGPITLHEEAATSLPPASAAAQSAVSVGGAAGRWTPRRGELEWVSGGVYHELDAPGLGLSELLGIAGSLAPAPGTGTTAPAGASP